MSVLTSSIASASTADSRPAWSPDLGDGRYQNPVLFADYSDPDAIRVGDDFWLTASSFSHVPGLPILHSRDLVNWTLVNHALPALVPADHFSVPRHGCGVWAPAIRFHGGRFWIFYPDPDFGIYMVSAADPRGTWTTPVLVKAGKGLIDPCPLWDDGHVYLIHGWAKSRAGKNNLITLHALSDDATRVIDGEGVVIIDENGSRNGLHTLEGPKLYKRGATYWIFAPVDGVETGRQAVYRSQNIRGPYEVRIVLAQGSTPINGPHQGAWIDTPAGEHWFLHFQDRAAYGRVVHLQPMSWGADSWPRMGTGVATGAETGEPVLTHEKPAVPPTPVAVPMTSDEFDSPQLGLQWQWQANPRSGWHSLTARPGWLRLKSVALPPGASLYDAPNLFLQKFTGPRFTATTLLDGSAADTAGLMVFGYRYAWLGVTPVADGRRLTLRVSADASKGGPEIEVAGLALPATKVHLRVTVDDSARCRFAYSVGGKVFVPIGDVFEASVAKWVGAKVGLFATARPAPDTAAPGHADFDFFHLTP